MLRTLPGGWYSPGVMVQPSSQHDVSWATLALTLPFSTGFRGHHFQRAIRNFVPAHDPKAKKPAMSRSAPRRGVAVLQWPPHSCGRAFGLQRGTTLGSCTQRCGARAAGLLGRARVDAWCRVHLLLGVGAVCCGPLKVLYSRRSASRALNPTKAKKPRT
jgi:hypothetical protein